jgi:hypothetical protein
MALASPVSTRSLKFQPHLNIDPTLGAVSPPNDYAVATKVALIVSVALLILNSVSMMGVHIPHANLVVGISNLAGIAISNVVFLVQHEDVPTQAKIPTLIYTFASFVLSSICLFGGISAQTLSTHLFTVVGINYAGNLINLLSDDPHTNREAARKSLNTIFNLMMVVITLLNALGAYGVISGLSGKLAIGVSTCVLLLGYHSLAYKTFAHIEPNRQLSAATKGILCLQIAGIVTATALGATSHLSSSEAAKTLFIVHESQSAGHSLLEATDCYYSKES